MAGFTSGAPNLQAGRPIYLRGERMRVRRARHDRDGWILLLDRLKTRAEAEALRGELVECKDSDVLREDEDSYFVYELIGLRVVTTGGRDLGTVAEVLQPGANDVYVVRDGSRDLLVPAIAEVVEGIDVRAGLITITPLPGMLDES